MRNAITLSLTILAIAALAAGAWAHCGACATPDDTGSATEVSSQANCPATASCPNPCAVGTETAAADIDKSAACAGAAAACAGAATAQASGACPHSSQQAAADDTESEETEVSAAE